MWAVQTIPSNWLPPRWVLAALFVVGLGWLFYALRGVLTPLFAAFLIAYVLDPVVDKLEARHLEAEALAEAMTERAEVEAGRADAEEGRADALTEKLAAANAEITRLQHGG